MTAQHEVAPGQHGHIVDAHAQPHTSHYEVHFPEHGTREDDPHYVDFHHYHEHTKHDPEIYQCAVGKRRGDFSDCTLDKPLELHHTHIEWALQNGVDLEMLERQYPGVSNREEVGAWVESAENLEWLCQRPSSTTVATAARTSHRQATSRASTSSSG